MTAQAMRGDIGRALPGIAEHDVLDLIVAAVGNVLDLLVQELGYVLALRIAQSGKSRHALGGTPTFQELRELRTMLILEDQLGVDETGPFGASRQWAMTERAIRSVHRRAALGRLGIRRWAQPQKLSHRLSRSSRRGGRSSRRPCDHALQRLTLR